jgi:hypothetical protein
MGAGPSSEPSALDTLYARVNGKPIANPPYAYLDAAFYEETKKDLAAFCASSAPTLPTDAVTGGAVTGGYDALQDYGNSLYSRAKEKLIRDIAEEVFKALHVSGAKNARTAPISDVVAHLQKLVPNPKKGKRFTESFNSSSSKQTSVCRALANAINSNYGGSIINLSAKDGEMCAQVADVMYSLFTGLHTEFMNVAGDVMRTIKNMSVVGQALESAYNKQKELALSAGDPDLKGRSDATDNLYKEIRKEYDRQMAVLSNLVNISVGPTGTSLISALEDSQEFTGLVRDIGAEPGTTEFGDKLAYLLSGVSTAARAAELVDKALKKIGMSIGEFRNSKNQSELRMKVFDKIMKDAPTSKRLDEMMAAAKIIYENTYDFDAVSKLLKGDSDKKKRRGGMGISGGRGSGDESESDTESVSEPTSPLSSTKEGGFGLDTYPAYWRKKDLGKKIENKRKYRELVFRDFRKMIRGYYQKIVDAANRISPKIGTSIPITDELYNFVQAFAQAPSLEEEQIHIALSGYAKDAASKEKRENFMNNYRLILETIQPLLKGPEGDAFKAIYTTITQLVKTIDDFSDRMVKAITEIHVDQPSEIQASLRRLKVGSGEDSDVFTPGSWVAFSKVQHEMDYYYKIAHIKTNMARMANELTDYTEDYDQILGEEAGWLIDRIKADMQPVIDAYDIKKDEVPDDPADAIKHKLHLISHNLREPAAGGGITPAAREELSKNMMTILTDQMNAKINMIKVAQAVDLYLKAFTNGIARNPDSIGSVLKLLSQVEIVAKWFTERSGDNLAMLFECFPAGYDRLAPVYSGGGDSAVIARDGTANLNIFGEHYYSWLEARVHADQHNLPGNPFLGRDVYLMKEQAVKGIFDLSEKAIKSMRALENILSAFSSVGSKFGDLDIQSQTFMNPGQILNHLTNYIKMSAFTTKFAPDVYTNDVGAGGVGGAAVLGNRADNIVAGVYISKEDAPAGVKTDEVGAVERKIPTIDDAQFRVLTGNHDLDAGGIGLAAQVLHATQRLSHAQALHVAGIADAKHNEITLVGAYGVLSGVTNEPNQVDAPRKKYQSLAMAAIPSDGDLDQAANGNANVLPGKVPAAPDALGSMFWNYHNYSVRDRGSRLDRAGWEDLFYDTDMLFQMTIKSIVCKIFTVVDAYRLFHRPTITRSLYSSMSPLRTIIGGGESGGATLSHVKILPEAVELYMRLPLLAEWYREMFGFKSKENASLLDNDENGWRLATVPLIDGVWSGFVSLVFDKADYVKEGNYGEPQVQKMIEEMNTIYKLYKSKYPKSTVRNIMNAFVMEMNRIFGFLKKKDVEDYNTNQFSYLTNPPGDERESFVDYDILNANDQFSSRPAPSDKFSMLPGPSVSQKSRTSRLYMQRYIDTIRRKIDLDFLRAQTSEQDFNFTASLRNYKREVGAAKNDVDAYKVVLQMIQGVSKQGAIGVDKVIMVHEAIAAPLAVVYAIYKILARYNGLIHALSFNNIESFNKMRPGPAAAPAAIKRQMRNFLETTNVYRAFVENTYDVAAKVNKTQLDIFVDLFVGLDNAHRGYFDRLPAGVGADTQFGYANLKTDLMMRDIVSALLDMGSSDSNLVSCNVGASGSINIDYSKLQDICTALLEQIKENIKKLRTSFPDNMEIVDKYEDVKTVGSTRWLEEYLVQQLFLNRDKAGLETAHTAHLASIFDGLTKYPIGGPTNSAMVAGSNQHPSMAEVFQEMIYYKYVGVAGGPQNTFRYDNICSDYRTFPFNAISLLKSNTELRGDEKKIIRAGQSHQAIAAGAGVLAATLLLANEFNPAPVIAFENMDTINTFDLRDNPNKSFLFVLNKIIHMYLYTNFEDGANKFYAPLIEMFANTVGSVEVLQGKAFPNITTRKNVAHFAGAVGGPYPRTQNVSGVAANDIVDPAAALNSPAPGSVIFASNALVMRSILQTVQMIGTSQKKRFIYDSLADVPEYLKERMRCNLPYFSKMMQNLFARVDILKKLMSYTGISKNIATGPAPVAGAAPVGAAGLDTAVVLKNYVTPLVNMFGKSSSNMHTYLVGLLDRMSEVVLGLKKSCDTVYKELNDKPPYFLESSKDFIADFKQRTGQLPFMPASAILMPLTATEFTAEPDSLKVSHVMMPVRENGSAPFKFNYGSRAILARNDVDPQIEHFPGAKEIYNNYAAKEGSNPVLSAQEYANTIKNMVKLVRFMADGVCYGRLYDKPSNYVKRFYQAAGNPAAPVAPRPTDSNSVFSNVQWLDMVLNDTNNGALEGGAANEMRNVHTADAGVMTPPAWQHIKEPGSDDYKMLHRMLSVFSLRNYVGHDRLAMLFNTLENTNLEVPKLALVNTLGFPASPIKDDARKNLRIHNIIDMGIVPLNVHAFMREIPFANISNYSYTFDRMVHEFIIPSYLDDKIATVQADAIMIRPNVAAHSTREILVKLLCHPWADLPGLQYFALVASLFNGNDNLKLGRPKYLSDQLWHKVLLTSSAQLVGRQPVFSTTHDTHERFPSLEAGPAAYEAVRAVVHYAPPSSVNATKSLHSIIHGNDDERYLAAASKKIFSQILGNHVSTTIQPAIAQVGTFNAVDWSAAIAGGGAAVPTVANTVLPTDAFMQQTAVSKGTAQATNAYTTFHGATRSGLLAEEAKPNVAGHNILDGPCDHRATEYIAGLTALRPALTAIITAVLNAAGGSIDAEIATVSGAARGNAGGGAGGNAGDEIKAHMAAVLGDAAIHGNANNLRHLVLGGNIVFPAGAAAAAGNVNTPQTPEAGWDTVQFDQLVPRNIKNRLIAAMNAHIAATVAINGPKGPAGSATALKVDEAVAMFANMIIASTHTANIADAAALRAIGTGVLAAFPHAGVNAGDFKASADAFNPGALANPVQRCAYDIRAGDDPTAAALQAVMQNTAGLMDACFAVLASDLRYNTAVLYLSLLFTQNAILRRSILGTIPTAAIAANPPLKLDTPEQVTILSSVFDNILKNDGMVLAPGTGTIDADFWHQCVEPIQIRGRNLADPIVSGVADPGDRLALGLLKANLNGADTFQTFMVGNGGPNYLADYLSGTIKFIVNYWQVLDQAYMPPGGPAHLPAPLTVGVRQDIYLTIPSDPVSTRGLKIWDAHSSTWRTGAATAADSMDFANVVHCAEIGKARFDTKLVRNLTWLVNLQRIMRVVLIRHLAWLDTPVIKGLKIADPKVTEYDGNDRFDEDDYTGLNYSSLL